MRDKTYEICYMPAEETKESILGSEPSEKAKRISKLAKSKKKAQMEKRKKEKQQNEVEEKMNLRRIKKK